MIEIILYEILSLVNIVVGCIYIIKHDQKNWFMYFTIGLLFAILAEVKETNKKGRKEL